MCRPRNAEPCREPARKAERRKRTEPKELPQMPSSWCCLLEKSLRDSLGFFAFHFHGLFQCGNFASFAHALAILNRLLCRFRRVGIGNRESGLNLVSLAERHKRHGTRAPKELQNQVVLKLGVASHFQSYRSHSFQRIDG